MELEIWSDIACPWCYIGKRRLEAALGQFDHADELPSGGGALSSTPKRQPSARATSRACWPASTG